MPMKLRKVWSDDLKMMGFLFVIIDKNDIFRRNIKPNSSKTPKTFNFQKSLHNDFFQFNCTLIFVK